MTSSLEGEGREEVSQWIIEYSDWEVARRTAKNFLRQNLIREGSTAVQGQ